MKIKSASCKKERLDFIHGLDEYILQKENEKRTYSMFIMGLLTGVLGSFVANIFYEASKSFDKVYLIFTNVCIVAVFLFFLWVVSHNFKEYDKEITAVKINREGLFNELIKLRK